MRRKRFHEPRAEIDRGIEEAFRNHFKGRATVPELFVYLWPRVSDEIKDHQARQGYKAAIGSYLRSRDRDGLPQAPEVNDHGEHAQLELAFVYEYRYVIARYMSLSKANRDQALKVAKRCFEKYGIKIDVDNPYAAESGA